MTRTTISSTKHDSCYSLAFGRDIGMDCYQTIQMIKTVLQTDRFMKKYTLKKYSHKAKGHHVRLAGQNYQH